MNGVLELLPHDMGLRVELDTNETYYLKSGWAERCDGIYGLACGYVDYTVLFSVLFLALVAYLGWAEATADTIILRDGSRSYACQTSRISQTPHNCKPVKEKRS